jgi:outer membrane receptor protein involved in Fe transport
LLAACVLMAGVLAGPLLAQAQEESSETGALAGVVVDGETGETLPGASVLVAGPQQGASTGVDGRYRISDLAPGTYEVEFSFVGYRAKTVTGVEVAGGETTALDVTLSTEAQELDEVVVTAEAARNTEAGLLKERQGAAAVSNAISAESISESGASDAAGAMKNVTGAAVTGGKYVNIRGLGGRYVNTTLNGAALPSAAPDQNAVQFDLFPAGLLENIVVSKTFTPDKAGNFTGGSVDIGTVAFPDELNLTVSSSVGYNTETSFASERFSFVDGLGGVPGTVPASGPPSFTDFENTPEEKRQLDAITESFGTALAPAVARMPVEQSYEASFGNEFTLPGERPLGVVVTASYDRNISGYTGGTTARFPLLSPGAASLSRELALGDESSTMEDLYSGLANVSFRPLEGQEIGVNLLYTRSNERQGRFQEGVGGELLQSGDLFRTRTIRKTERTVMNGQVRGEHTFGQRLLERAFGSRRGARFTWNAALNRTDQNEPDYRQFANEIDSSGAFRGISTAGYSPPSRFFRNFEEDGRSAEGTLEIPLAAVADVKIGASYARKERAFRQRRFVYEVDESVDYNENPAEFFGEQGGIVGTGPDGEPVLGTFVQESSRATNNYNGERTVRAGFAMADVRVGPLIEALGGGEASVPVLSRLRVIGGVRREQTNQSVNVFAPAADLVYPLADSLFVPAGQLTDAAPGDGRIDRADWLPSLNLVYNVTDAMNVRAAYGKTLARPNFREFAPARFSRYIGGYDLIGNPELRLTTVDNFDVRWEWFPNPGEVLAVSGFYKRFTDAITRTFVPVNNPNITLVNAPRSRVYGAELEVSKRLGFLTEALRGLQAGANLTLARSNSEVPVAGTSSDTTFVDRPFQGQSDYLVNADLAYDAPETGTSASLYYNVFGERLTEITRDAGPDRFEQPRHTLDFVFAQRLAPLGLLRGMEVKLKVKNLLGADYEVARTYRGETYPVRRYERGRSFTLGLEYSL